MAAELKIPPDAICPDCGNPMRVVRYEPLAIELGFKVPEGGLYAIECCGHGLLIEDEEVEREIVALLERYQAAVDNGVIVRDEQQASDTTAIRSAG